MVVVFNEIKSPWSTDQVELEKNQHRGQRHWGLVAKWPLGNWSRDVFQARLHMAWFEVGQRPSFGNSVFLASRAASPSAGILPDICVWFLPKEAPCYWNISSEHETWLCFEEHISCLSILKHQFPRNGQFLKGGGRHKRRTESDQRPT